jgi:hypothetical protein
VLFDFLAGVLGAFVPTPHRLQRWSFRHPILASTCLGGFVFVGLSMSTWLDGEWPIPWKLTGGLGLGTAVFTWLLIIVNRWLGSDT